MIEIENIISFYKGDPAQELKLEDEIQYNYLSTILSVFNNRYLTNYLNLLREKIINYNETEIQIIFSELNGLLIDSVMDVKLIGLCASHIDNLKQLNKLDNMLQSWNNQNMKIKLILSISFNDEIIDFINDILNKYESLVIIRNNGKKSQFEHYKLICDLYSQKYKDYYVLFGDKDIWTKNRTLAYATLIKMNEIVNYLPFYIIYPYILESEVYISNDIELVNNYLSGVCKITNGYERYTTYSIKMNIFHEFVNNCDQKLLKNKYCNRYFIKSLLRNKSNSSKINVPLFGYGYYHNKYNNLKYITDIEILLSDTYIIDKIYLYYSLEQNHNPIQFVDKYCLSNDMNIESKNTFIHKFLDMLNNYKYLEKIQ
uniref:Uncharacterized protein n=1 Tax=viral metagenome TaxID=1070528 RepID=A0A6C0LRC9_9ZZZZ